jgi:hypothetical protein
MPMYYKILSRAFPLLPVCVLLAAPAACAAPSARQYLDEAVAATPHITLTGDQSTARRMISQCLAPIDVEAARRVAAAVARPSDAARAATAIAQALAPKDRKAALEVAHVASQLLLRIADREQRLQEQRLFLTGIAFLGADAPPLAAELPEEEARSIVVASLATSQPAQAAALAREWSLAAPRGDRARAALAVALAPSDAAQATEIAAGISEPSLRDTALLGLASARPPAEAAALAHTAVDPVAASAIIAQGAARQAETSVGEAQTMAKTVAIAPTSALAVVAVEAAATDEPHAAALARQLPFPARQWALGHLAITFAVSNPEQAEAYLAEAGNGGEAARIALGRMAAADPDRALRLARALPVESDRDAALAEVAVTVAGTQAALAKELVWEVRSPASRARAVEGVAAVLARTDTDAATSLLGLLTDEDEAARAVARVAAAVASRDPEAAHRLLGRLRPGPARARGALAAAREALAAGRDAHQAVALAELAVSPDLARRWLLPQVVSRGDAPSTEGADSIDDAYLRVLGLVNVAASMVSPVAQAQPCPERAQVVRPIVEWEGI